MAKYFLYTETCVKCKKVKKYKMEHDLAYYKQETESISWGTCEKCKSESGEMVDAHD